MTDYHKNLSTVTEIQKSKNPKIFTESLDLQLFLEFLDFHVFFWIFWVESKKTLGNVWILLVSVVKIIIFSRVFLDFVLKSKKNLGKV